MMSTILWTLYVVGFVGLLSAYIAIRASKVKLGASDVVSASFVMLVWPAFFVFFAAFTLIYILAWTCLPTIRQRVSLIEGIKDYWS